ncbi:MAG TPA: ChaN family lipoprotein, partial [Caulobacteraceae bacterium]|nr:ChaN family lipoprotein [Caulobacteraceae bacterium]
RLDPEQRRRLAAEIVCPDDAYRARFMAELEQAAAGHGGDGAGLARAYQAQCAKDETMAEAVAARLGPGRTVIHVNGAFHTDGRLGAAARTTRRRPEANLVVLSVRSGRDAAGAADVAALKQAYGADVGDYLIMTR